MFCAKCGARKEEGGKSCAACGAGGGTSQRRHNNRRLIAIVAGILGVVLITVLVISLSGGENRLTGSWESVAGDGSGVVYEFATDSFTWSIYSRDGVHEFTEGSYSVSGNEIRFVSDGGSWTQEFQFVGDNLVIGDAAFTQVRGNNFSFEIVEYSDRSVPTPAPMPDLIGTWEYVAEDHSWIRESGIVYEFAIDSLTVSIYRRDGNHEFHEGLYTVSDNELRLVFGNNAATHQFHFVGENLVISNAVLTRVIGDNFSFEIVPEREFMPEDLPAEPAS